MPQSQRIGQAVTAIAAIVILAATLTPDPGETVLPGLCIICGPLGGVDVILNILLFVPLGVGLALQGTRFRWAIFAAFALSAAVETAQLFIPGRDPSIGDVITNTLGAAIGFALCVRAPRWLTPTERAARLLTLCWTIALLAIQTTVSFSLAPVFPRSTYYGQLARELAGYEKFQGRIVTAKIDSVVIPDDRLTNTEQVAELLRRGPTASATVIPASATSAIAPILRVVDEEEQEIILLAQDGRDFLFEVSTGASILRLRPTTYSLPAVFPATDQRQSGGAGSVTLMAASSPNEIRLTARTGQGVKSEFVPVSASLGWTLFIPFEWHLQNAPGERVAGFLWMTLLFLPLGYFAGFALLARAQWNSTTRNAEFALASIIVTGIGLALIPLGFHLAPMSALAWSGELFGLILGAGLATKVSKFRVYQTAESR